MRTTGIPPPGWTVHVNAYKRKRMGKEELVKSHWRRAPGSAWRGEA